jgi:hypothetical protein
MYLTPRTARLFKKLDVSTGACPHVHHDTTRLDPSRCLSEELFTSPKKSVAKVIVAGSLRPVKVFEPLCVCGTSERFKEQALKDR